MSPVHWVSIALLALLVLGLKEGLIDRTENLFRARLYDGTRVPGVGNEAQINYGDAFTLHGYDLPTRPVVAGDPLRVDLYLSARREIEGEYMAYARLVDDEGRLWSLSHNGAPEGYRPPPPTSLWPSDAYGHWAYLAYTLPGTPPGEYWIEVALFERDTWRGLNVLDAQGLATGLTARIGPVQIARPRTPPNVGTLGIEHSVQVPIAGELRCLGSALDARSAQAGQEIRLSLLWRAMRRPGVDYRLSLSLVSGETAYPLGENLSLGREEYPTTRWQEGEIVRSLHPLLVPAGADAKEYAVEVTVVDDHGQPVGAPFVVGEIAVEPTDRLMVVPVDVEHRVDADLGGRVTLLGYDLALVDGEMGVERGGSLPVTLYWRARREMIVSYKVFVQLVGPDGVLAQVDTVPVRWTRPTTGWVAGEVVVDPYALSIPGDAPAASYSLIAGMYDERSLQRLAVRDASGTVVGDHVVLAKVVVE